MVDMVVVTHYDYNTTRSAGTSFIPSRRSTTIWVNAQCLTSFRSEKKMIQVDVTAMTLTFLKEFNRNGEKLKKVGRVAIWFKVRPVLTS